MCTVLTVTWNLSAGLGVNNTSPSLVTPLSPSLWSAKPSLPPTGLKRFVVTCFRSCHSLTDSTLSSIILCRAPRPVAGEVPLCKFYILLSIFLAWKCSIKSSCIIPASTSASYLFKYALSATTQLVQWGEDTFIWDHCPLRQILLPPSTPPGPLPALVSSALALVTKSDK